MSSVKTVILCGGQGTRIRDVANDIPKPMVQIGNRPILWHIMKTYAHYGVKDFVLCLGHKGWVIKEYFFNYRAISSDATVTLGEYNAVEFHNNPVEDWRVILAETGEDTQTGGRLSKVKKYIEDCEIFCVTYGDGVADININQLLSFHRSHGRIGTVTGVRPPGRFGVMGTNQRDGVSVVHDFQEKAQTDKGWINGGFFVFDQRLWNYMHDDAELIFEHEPLAKLAQDGQLVMYEHTGFWQPMDTFREWKILNNLWHAHLAPWRVW